ncbi:MAG TPA: hypothetical protein VGJ91_01540 [Polyangiaceae bacterium]
MLKGCFASVTLALLGASAYFQAFALTRLLACAIGAAPAATRAATTAPARPPPPPSATSLLERNPFDSLTGPLATPTGVHADERDPLAAPVCKGPRLYIVSEADDRRWSMATLQGAEEPRPRLRRVGDEVERKRIEYIGFNPRQGAPAVWLSSGPGLCQTLLFERKTAQPGQRAAGRSSIAAAEPPERVPLVPELKAGKLLGLRVVGIRPGGAFAAIGLQNGDRVEAINGLTMNSPEHALELYAKLATTSDFYLRVVRRGRPIGITLHLK